MKRSWEISSWSTVSPSSSAVAATASRTQGPAPDQGDGAGAAVLPAPAADDVVVEVDPPVRVVVGEDVGEVGLGLEVGGVAAGRLHVGDVAEQLQRPLGALGVGEQGTQIRPPQARSGNQSSSAGVAAPSGRSSIPSTASRKAVGQALGEAPVRESPPGSCRR